MTALDWVRCHSCQFTMFKATPGFRANLGTEVMEIRCKRCDGLNRFGGEPERQLVPDGSGGFLTVPLPAT